MSEIATTPDFDPVPAIAAELGLPPRGVHAVVDLLAECNTVPFIARCGKERTGGLDEVQIRTIEEQRSYLLELEARLRAATTKAAVEDLYLPFKPKRRTRATGGARQGA